MRPRGTSAPGWRGLGPEWASVVREAAGVGDGSPQVPLAGEGPCLSGLLTPGDTGLLDKIFLFKKRFVINLPIMKEPMFVICF